MEGSELGDAVTAWLCCQGLGQLGRQLGPTPEWLPMALRVDLGFSEWD